MERARGPNWRRGSNRCPSRRAGSASSCWRRSIFWFGNCLQTQRVCSGIGSIREQTRWVCKQLLAQIDFLVRQIQQLEQRLEDLVEVTPEMERLMTLPGIAEILAATIALEIGDIGRFPDAPHLASYAGTTPAGAR